MDSKRLRDLREAYGSIYEPEVELTEEQVWEEVESWVSSLIEDGYDLSEYTWKEMYEAYLEEVPVTGNKMLDRFLQGGQAFLQGKPRPTGVVTRDIQAAQERLDRERAKPTKPTVAKPTVAKPTVAKPINTPPAAPILPPPERTSPTAARASSSGSIAPRPAASAPTPRPSTATAPTKPTGPAIGKLGSTSFERRTPTSAELRAAQAARAGGASPEKALQAAQKTNLPTTGPSPSVINKKEVETSKVNFTPRDMKKNPLKSSYEWGSTSKLVEGIANAYSSIYEAKKVDQDKDGDNDFADVRIARLIASGVSKEEAIRRVKDKSYNEEVEIDEATAMAKKGYNETEIRNKIAKSTGGGKTADKATALADRETYGNKEKKAARENLARKQRGDFRKTTSSSPGLHGYAHKSNDPAVKAKQAARGAQRGVLTPREKKQLNREAYAADNFTLWINDLIDEGYDLSDYTWDEMAEIYEETELEKKKAKEEAIAARRARVAQLQSQGRVMTSAKRTKGAAAQRKEEKRAEALERAANAILRQTTGSSGKVSDKPMGSEAPAPKEQAPEANRRLKTGLRRDTLGTAADDVLKGKK